MREQDIILLSRFVNRTHTLTGLALQSSITSFIAGYEIGTDLQCKFTEILAGHLRDTYAIELTSAGWPGQVDRFSERENIDWFGAFKKLTIEVLEKEISRLGN